MFWRRFLSEMSKLPPPNSSKRPFSNAHGLDPIRQVICQHGHAICGVVVDVFHGEAEAGHLVHDFPVIIVPAVIRSEVKCPDCRRVLLYSRQLRHICWGFFVRHVDAVLVLLPEDAVHIVAVLIAAVIGLGAPHLYLMLQDLRHHPGLGATLITAVKNPVVDKQVKSRQGRYGISLNGEEINHIIYIEIK